MTTPVIEPPGSTRRAPQPRILSRFLDAFGMLHVVDEDGGDTVVSLPPDVYLDADGELQMAPNPQNGGSTFGVSCTWPGGTTEIRWSYSDDSGNNRSYVWVGLYGHTSGFRTWGNGYFNLYINGDWTWTGSVDVSGGWALLAARDAWVGHDAAGAGGATVGVTSGEVYNTSFDAVWGTQWHGFSNYTVLPYAPQNVKVRAGTVATTSFGVEYTRNSHDYVDYDHVHWATDPGFSNIVWNDTNAQGYSNPLGVAGAPQLTPGTTYYVRVYSHTAAGFGPASATVSQVTLPATPPGFTVSSSPSGSQASLAFTPPGGVTGVSPYRYERRATGTTQPVVSTDTTTNAATVTGLTPGASYDWRASAFIGTYQSPWTEWITLVQAKPNINPGDYFDGSTADKADLDYSWTGTANASTSVATAKGVAGWNIWTGGSVGAVLYRVTAGLFSPFAARVQVTADSNAIGQLSIGQTQADPYRTEVTADTVYVGSIHVRPSRSQSMAAEIVFYDAAGTALTAPRGAPTTVPGGTWARLLAGGTAPSGAKWAVVRAADGAAPAWTNWRGGDTIDLDGAMISLNEEFPYFDGDFLADDTYIYEWTEAPNASPSTRTPVAQVNGQRGAFMPERGGLFLPSRLVLTDPDCAVVPEPPRPPIIASDCIEEVGVWRRYYTEIPANLVPDWIDVVPTLEITSASLAARQVRIRYYPNPGDLSPGEVDTTIWVAEQIISFMPAHTVLTLDGVTQHVWAEVNGADPISADHLLYGTNGKPATWPVLSCGIAYLISIEVPIAEPAGNIAVEASLTART
jgi:hypothetical protein